MGQCSTLPEKEDNKQTSDEQNQTMPTMNQSKLRAFNQSTSSSQSKKQSREQRDSNYYGRPGDEDTHRHNDGDVVMNDGQGNHERANYDKMVNVVKHSKKKLEPLITDEAGMNAMASPQHRTSSSSVKSGKRQHQVHPAPPPIETIPKVPDGAVRTRCYRLNLDAPVVLSPTHDHLGPFPYDPPPHLVPSRTSSSSRRMQSPHSGVDDMSVESVDKSSTQVAIDTARIFRGITVDKNGVILSQNARASRSSRGRDKTKQGEKSRQAAKIDKAKDLVDEAISNAGKENDGEKSNMVSLAVVGEYDDMKQLVRDGAKKLRDAEDLPDEALLGINRLRHNQHMTNSQFSTSNSSRKRFPSPYTTSPTAESPSRSRSRNRVQQMVPQSNPPKLKGHPRDRPSSRRMSSGMETTTNEKQQSRCNDISLFGGGDSDWSEALNFSKGFNSIWNCGGTGNNAGSPKSTVASPVNGANGAQSRYEGRNESSTRFQGDDMGSTRDAPGGKDVAIM